jgi:hypothetical protein
LARRCTVIARGSCVSSMVELREDTGQAWRAQCSGFSDEGKKWGGHLRCNTRLQTPEMLQLPQLLQKGALGQKTIAPDWGRMLGTKWHASLAPSLCYTQQKWLHVIQSVKNVTACLAFSGIPQGFCLT